MLDVRNLTLEQIKNMLDLDDTRSVKNWLAENNIPFSLNGRKYVVNQFMFELKQQQLAVEELKISYPSKWFEIYDANTPDKGMVKAISELYPRKNLIKVKKSKENSYIK